MKWSGETAFLLGGGPSLHSFDMSVLAGRRCIAINNSWELKMDADVLYFCDSCWWTKMPPKTFDGYWTNGEAVKARFQGPHIMTISTIAKGEPRVTGLRNGAKRGLETRPDTLAHGGNSGFQAINLAYHFGVSRIVLLGYDMHVDGERTHWHQGHGKEAAVVEHQLRKSFLPAFQTLVEPLAAAGVEVVNCTPGSSITCWPYQPLEAVL